MRLIRKSKTKMTLALAMTIGFIHTAHADNSICGMVLCEEDMMPGNNGPASVSSLVFGNPDPTNLNTNTPAAAPSMNASTISGVSAASASGITSASTSSSTTSLNDTGAAPGTTTPGSTKTTNSNSGTSISVSAGTSGLGALP
jgi:hypothetical protein